VLRDEVDRIWDTRVVSGLLATILSFCVGAGSNLIKGGLIYFPFGKEASHVVEKSFDFIDSSIIGSLL
jgi:hypothetical protein